jgi:hypothetical protein
MATGGQMRPLTHSPSGLKTAKACQRQWADMYVNGNRDQEVKENLIFGSLTHNALEVWAHGGSLYNAPLPERLRKDIDKLRLALVTKFAPEHGPIKAQIVANAKIEDLIKEAPIRALTALRHLPDRDRVHLMPEAPFTLSVQYYHAFAGEAWAVSPNSSRDLVAVYPDTRTWKLFDYKTTSDFRWALTSAQLLDDIQWLIYGLATLDQANQNGSAQTVIDGAWVYMRSKQRPESQVTPVSAVRDALAAGLRPWFELADELTGHLVEANRGRKFDLADYPAADTTTPCKAYGRTCHLSREVGGPCDGPPAPEPFGWASHRLPVIQPERKEQPMHTPEQVPANLAQRLQETAAALPFRPTEVAAHMAPAAPAPGYTYRHQDGNTYPIFGLPGQLAKYSNGNPVTDVAGRYLDVLGCPVTDGAHQAPQAPAAEVAPPAVVLMAPAAYAVPQVQTPPFPAVAQATAYVPSATPPAVPVAPVQVNIEGVPPAAPPAPAEPYTPPPAAVVTPKPAALSKGRPRRGKAETEESYQARVRAWEAEQTAAPVASVLAEATIASAEKVPTIGDAVEVGTRPFGSVGMLLDDLRKAAKAVTEAGYTVEIKVVL